MGRDPYLEQTAAGLSTTYGISGDLRISLRERQILRDLAYKVAELASRPLEKKKKKLWTDHNDLKKTHPLIFIDPENGWNEIITQIQILCEKPLFRVWEMALRKEIFWAEGMKDDRVIENYFNVPYNYEDTGWGLSEKKIQSDMEYGSYVWDAPVKNYTVDMPKLKFPEVIIDYKKTEEIVNLASDILGDILTVRLRDVWWWTLGMTWDFIRLRGLEQFMIDMIENPEGVHKLMSFLRDGTLKKA